MTPHSIKKPKSNFLIFCDERRPDIKAKNPELKVTDVIRECSRQWSALSDAERNMYTQKYLKEKEVYLKQVQDAQEAAGSLSEVVVETKPVKEKKPRAAVSNGYIKFCSAVRESVKLQNPELGPKDIMKKIGENWNALSLEDKASYKSGTRVVEPKPVEPVVVKEVVAEVAVPAAPKKVRKSRKVTQEPVLA